MPDTSTKPYFLRAIYEWCTDNGYTPHIAVKVDSLTQVPMEFVRKGEIVLNIAYGATKDLKIDNEAVHFYARFNGIARELYVPVANVLAIYANENGQGMGFEVTQTADQLDKPAAAPVTEAPALTPVNTDAASDDTSGDDEPPKKGPRPTLTRIK